MLANVLIDGVDLLFDLRDSERVIDRTREDPSLIE